MAKKINVRPLRFWLLWDDVLSFMSVAFIWAILAVWRFSSWQDMAVFRFLVFAFLCVNTYASKLHRTCDFSRWTTYLLFNFLIRPHFQAKTGQYVTKKAAQWVNFRRFSLVYLSFINRSPWKLVKMCILISLTNHITTTFWSDHFYIPKQANIW